MDESERIALVVPPSLKARIDDWRRKQASIPTRASAVRHLLELGLEAAEAARSRDAPTSAPGAVKPKAAAGKAKPRKGR
jgi:hypothetical protein